MNKTIRKSILTITLFSGGFLFSQTHVLEGRVLDEKDNSPMQGVTVKVNDKETKTDASGYYVITLDPGKNYSVNVIYKGYNKKEISDVEIKSAENTNLDILLTKIEAKGKDKEIEGVVLRSSAKKETIASTIGLQKNMGVVSVTTIFFAKNPSGLDIVSAFF